MTNETTEITEEHPHFSEFLQRALKRVGHAACEKAWAAGHHVTVLEHGKLVQIYPDGSRKEIEQ